MLRQPVIFALVPALACLACGSVVELPADPQGSTSTTAEPPGGTTDDPASSTSTSSSPPEPQTTTDPFDPTTGSTGGEPGTSSSGVDTCGPGSFLCDPTGVEPSECSMWEQDCAEGEKCNPWANDGGTTWNALRCVPIDASPDGPGEPCTVENDPFSGIDSCALGSMCWDADPRTLVGVCIPHCAGDVNAPLCEPDRTCVLGGDSLVAMCLRECHPLEQVCPAGNGCYPWDTSFVCAPDASEGSGGLFEPCQSTNGCTPGHLCASPEEVGLCPEGASGCCTSYCDLTAPDCPEPTGCVPAFPKGQVPPGYENVGFCLSDG